MHYIWLCFRPWWGAEEDRSFSWFFHVPLRNSYWLSIRSVSSPFSWFWLVLFLVTNMQDAIGEIPSLNQFIAYQNSAPLWCLVSKQSCMVSDLMNILRSNYTMRAEKCWEFFRCCVCCIIWSVDMTYLLQNFGQLYDSCFSNVTVW